MLRKITLTLAVLALIGTTLAVCGGALAAAPAPGGSADNAEAIPTGPTTVDVGQRRWYGFQYAGDGSPILVNMSATPDGSAGFSVWTADNVRSWEAGQGENPIGRGSQQVMRRRQDDGSIEEITLYDGNLIWTGSFRAPGVYYVVVDQTGPVPATIDLTVTGSGVSTFPGATPAPTATATPIPTSAASVCPPAPAPQTLALDGPGSAPAQALSLPSDSAYLLPVGRRAWFAFQYNGDESQILIDLRATPDESAGFAVYTPGSATPVGRGSQQTTTRRNSDGTLREVTLYGGDLVWMGNFSTPGTYYVAVDQTGPNPSTIRLGINGRGVSGSQAIGDLPSNAQAPICVAPPSAGPTPVTVPAGGPGNGPDQALPLPSDSEYLLIRGQQAWFAFEYNGNGSQILITMSEAPQDSVRFAVYPPDNTTTPVGWGARQTMTRHNSDGTTKEFTLFDGALAWSGNFPSAGTIYVRVVQADPRTSTIRFDVSGNGVSAPPSR